MELCDRCRKRKGTISSKTFKYCKECVSSFGLIKAHSVRIRLRRESEILTSYLQKAEGRKYTP